MIKSQLLASKEVATMDRIATPDNRMVNMVQGFEHSRLSEGVLASVYECLLPLVGRLACLPQEHSKTGHVDRQPRQAQARRAS
jgi:hypothetical protein